MQYLMHQLGPATPEITAITQQEIDSWLVEFDEDVSIDMSWQESPTRMLMCCSLGQPDEAMRVDVYASLLSANLLLTGLANVKLALSQPEDEVMLIGEYEPGDASLNSVQKNLAQFLQFADKFSQLVIDPAASMLEPRYEENPFETQQVGLI